jgi:hypothetical protein
MAGLTDNTTAYAGKDAEGFYSTALLTGNSKSNVRQVLNNKNKIKLASLDMGDFLQEDACDLEESGTYTLAQKEISVCDFGFKIPFCVKDWETNYLSQSMKPGANTEENYPNGVVDYIFEQVALKISEETERLFFQGDTAGSPADLCDGIQKKLLADGAVLDVAVDGTKLHTAADVIGELQEMYEKCSAEMLAQFDKLRYFINPKTARAFRLALVADHPALYASNDANLTLTYMGIPMIVCPGLGDHKALLCDPMNLIFTTDLTSDEMQVTFEAKPNTNGKVHYAMGSFKFGAWHIKGAEIVYYN